MMSGKKDRARSLAVAVVWLWCGCVFFYVLCDCCMLLWF